MWVPALLSSINLSAELPPDGDAVELAEMLDRNFSQAVSLNSSLLEAKFVRPSSISKPLHASVTGSWSKRGSLFAAFTMPKVLLVVTEKS
jgi:hypothetical protein